MAAKRGAAGPRTLVIDIGGTGLKAMVLDASGKPLTERVRVVTPVGATPARIVATLAKLVAPLPGCQRATVGFPGVVNGGRVVTAPNLGNAAWRGFDLAGALAKTLGVPVKVLNDADLQGLGVIRGRGVEMVITLGTGFGTGLYMDGWLGPHLELAHHPFRKGETYDQQLGDRARKSIGDKRWNRRVQRAIENLRTLTNFDRLYIGGGNARHLDFELAKDMEVVTNEEALRGGIAPWRGER